MTVSLTEKRKETLLKSCLDISRKRVITIRELARLIGLMVASFPATPHGPLYYRTLEKEKIIALKKNGYNWEQCLKLSQKALKEISWWIQITTKSYSPISLPKPDVIISTDASMKAWGAACNGKKTGGAWTHRETTTMHINELEMLAAYLGMKSFIKLYPHAKHVLIYLDNSSAMFCIQKFG